MIQRLLITLLSILLLPSMAMAQAQVRTVRNPIDANAEGTLRHVLKQACDEKGDDEIAFDARRGPFSLDMIGPLVIPDDCLGHVTITGLDQSEVILDFSDYIHTARSPYSCGSEDNCVFPAPGYSPDLNRGLGGAFAGDSCILHVYSDGHTIQNVTFLGNEFGAGVCLFGRSNTVRNDRFGQNRFNVANPNRYGVVASDLFAQQFPAMDGSQNLIVSNRIEAVLHEGIWVEANQAHIESNVIRRSASGSGVYAEGERTVLLKNTAEGNWRAGFDLKGVLIEATDNVILSNGGDGIRAQATDSSFKGNEIVSNGGCPSGRAYPGHREACLNTGGETFGAGIRVLAGSDHLLVGGLSFIDDANGIFHNLSGGVILENDRGVLQNRISHNAIFENYGPNIDLGDDGATPNDAADVDDGPNRFLNFMDYMQVFPLVTDRLGGARYWAWGIARSGSEVELYRASDDEAARNVFFGGAENFLDDAPIQDDTFEVSAGDFGAPGGNDFSVSGLTFDTLGNTSEFGLTLVSGPDSDLDGVPDRVETARGTLQDEVDSDRDGLADGIEDKNHNGQWDTVLGETRSDNPDSDGDGVSDFDETHGDGIYHPGQDTDPLVIDTDRDGLNDGAEDANGNGVWEAHLRETSPLLRDSDGDGHPDSIDNCPVIPNRTQDPRGCRP